MLEQQGFPERALLTLLAGGGLAFLAAASLMAQVPAFPGAEGFGANALGGRGGAVIYVTNLNDSGPGSLREAIDTPGPRFVLFRLSGTIILNTPLSIDEPFITIAGQSAPGDGIALRNSGQIVKPLLSIHTHDVVIRYLRVRPGPDTSPQGSGNLDAVDVSGSDAHDVILDHVSMSWAVDEVMEIINGAHDITLQWSIVAEGLYCSNHEKTVTGSGGPCPGGGNPHSRAMTISTFPQGDSPDRISLHHNLWANTNKRYPNITSNTLVDSVNNVLYNLGDFGSGLGPKTPGWIIRLNYRRNFIKPGPETIKAGGTRPVFSITDTSGNSVQIFYQENQLSDPIAQETGGSLASFFVSTPFTVPHVASTPAAEAFDAVVAEAGATLPKRDSVDTRIVDDVLTGTGNYVNDPSEVGGWPELLSQTPPADSDGDGMPDSWETENGLDPQDDSDGSADPDLDGYTNVEEFLNGTPPNPSSLSQCSNPLYFPQFGDGDELISSEILLINPDPAAEAQGRILLRRDDGTPLTIDLNGKVFNGQADLVIPAAGMGHWQSDGQGTLTAGSATICSDRPLAGVLLFGGPIGVAGVGSSAATLGDSLAPVETDSSAGTRTALALMNLESSNSQVELQLSDESGQPLATGQVMLAGLGHAALFLDEVSWDTPVDFSQFRGLLKANSAGQYAAIVLQTRPGELATLPVSRLAPSGSGQQGTSTLFFAQFGDGAGQVSSQIALFNPATATPVNAQITLRDDNGLPLSVDLNGAVVDGQTAAAVPAFGLEILESDGQGPLQSGSVTVTSDALLNGLVLFTGSAGTAGVANSQELSDGFLAPLRSNADAGINTGVALMNLEQVEVTVQWQLLDVTGTLLATTTTTLSALGHQALFPDSLAWSPVVDFSDFRGLLRVTTSGRVAATVIQTRPGQFATLPVVALSP